MMHFPILGVGLVFVVGWLAVGWFAVGRVFGCGPAMSGGECTCRCVATRRAPVDHRVRSSGRAMRCTDRRPAPRSCGRCSHCSRLPPHLSRPHSPITERRDVDAPTIRTIESGCRRNLAETSAAIK
jgi:hypothetical protein